MPPFETMDRHQIAVLWPLAGVDVYNEPVRGEPEEIEVRWVWETRQMPGPQGTPVVTSATVVVAQEVTVGSLMWLGTLDDWYGAGSAGDDESLMEVLASSKATDIKNRFTRRTLGLNYFRETPPTQGE